MKTKEKSCIIFYGKYPDDKKEVMRIAKDGFYYKGERIDDIYNVYDKFNKWLNKITK